MSKLITLSSKKRAVFGRPAFKLKVTGGIMFGLGHWELLIILVICLIIFGAGKLPEIGAGLGRSIKNFKKGVADVDSEIRHKLKKIETE